VFVVTELSILSRQLIHAFLEGSVVVLQLSVSLGEVLDNDLTLKLTIIVISENQRFILRQHRKRA
jgi:hypothetical protein